MAEYPYRDWDYFTSMAESLRLYLFQHHTVPQWNYMICGGKPELANPQSWAFTWPSLLVYVMPPLATMICLWVALTAIGWESLRRLLLRLGAEPSGAVIGASLFAVNGFFAAQLSQGHVTFAFFHLVPLLMLLFVRLADAVAEGRPLRGPFLAAVGASFAFFTAALPHALFYFFEAFVVVLLVRLARLRKEHGTGRAVRAAALAAVVLALGAVLSAYKLWPVIDWQLHSPRQGVVSEQLTPGEVAADLLRFDYTFDDEIAMEFEHQAWSAWEYNAFVGWTPWAVSLVAGFLWLRRRRQVPPLLVIGLATSVIGVDLALGNESPVSLSHVFRWLPLVDGIRVFPRFQILLVFGTACLVSLAVPACIAAIQAPDRRRLARLVLPLAVLLPGAIEAVTLLTSIRTTTAAEIASTYKLPPPGEVPVMVRQVEGLRRFSTHQTYLLDAGYWIANCYEPLHVRRPKLGDRKQLPLTDPPAKRILSLGDDSLQLLFDPPPTQPVRVLLGDAEELVFDAPAEAKADGEVTVHLSAAARPGVLTIRRPQSSPRTGAAISAVGVLLLGGWILGLRRR